MLIPLELLRLIFSKLRNKDLRTCKLVNKLWNKTAQHFVEEYIHVELDADNCVETMTEISNHPLLASKITKLTNRSSQISLIEYLKLCPNVLILTVYKPIDDLTQLYESSVALARLEEIILVGTRHNSTMVQELYLSCCKKYKDTIKSIELKIEDERPLPDLSIFSNLKTLHVNSLTRTKVKLDEILCDNRFLTHFFFVNVFIDSNSPGNEMILPPSKLCMSFIGNKIHINALRFLLEIADNIEVLMLEFFSIETDPTQNKDQVFDILEKIVDLPINVLMIDLCYDSRAFKVDKVL